MHPKPIRARYKATGDWTRYTRDFKFYLAAQATAVASLRETAAAAATCLMCYEADFNRCHRLFVAEVAMRQAGGMRHLLMASRSKAIESR